MLDPTQMVKTVKCTCYQIIMDAFPPPSWQMDARSHGLTWAAHVRATLAASFPLWDTRPSQQQECTGECAWDRVSAKRRLPSLARTLTHLAAIASHAWLCLARALLVQVAACAKALHNALKRALAEAAHPAFFCSPEPWLTTSCCETLLSALRVQKAMAGFGLRPRKASPRSGWQAHP